MKILGLTGSIGMGKSTAAVMLKRLRIPVHEADGVVHALLGPKGAGVAFVSALFPQALQKNNKGQAFIDRAILGRMVFGDAAALKKLEAVLHPLVQASEKKFIRRARAQRKRVVVLDIPLLFETQAERRVDGVVVVSAPAFIQRQRVLSRKGMSTEKLKAILTRQTPDSEKRKKADAVIATGLGWAVTFKALKKLLRSL